MTTAASAAAFALGAAVGARRAHRVTDTPTFHAQFVTPECPPSTTPALDCPVCLTELVLPRLAPCGHTLCSSCLVSLFEHERRPACPVW